MLSLGSVNANADDNYFTGVSVNTGYFYLIGSNTLTVDTASNVGSTSATRASAAINDVYFAPSSFVTSTYTSTLSSVTADDTFTTDYHVEATSSVSLPSLTLTFSSGSNANNIQKDSMTEYSAATQNTSLTLTDGTLSLSSSTTSGYTANLIFSGTNVVSGFTDIDSGNITINGGATFAGTVQAGSVDIDTSSLVTFNGHVNLSGSTDVLTFNNGGQVILNNGLGGDVNFNGQNAKVTLSNGSISGNVDTSVAGSGTLSFTTNGYSTVDGSIGASAPLKEISIDGTGVMGVTGDAYTNLVTFNSAGTFAVAGDLDTTHSDNSIGNVVFNQVDGTLEVGGDLTANISTVNNNQGTVEMSGNGAQSIRGSLGSSSNIIKNLMIGEDSATTSYTNIYATTTTLSYDGNSSSTSSSLSMDNGKNLHSTVVTAFDGDGVLNLLGGTQYVTGQVGESGMSLAEVHSGADDANSTFQSDVYANVVQNDGNGTSNFNTNVTATTINVNNGTSNFTNDVTATTTNIGTGTGNFNTNGTGTTISDIAFTGNGTANLHTGLTGNIHFGGEDGVVNVWDTKTVDGNITTTTNNTGILNYRGDGDIMGTVGAANMGIASLNINTNSDQNTTAGVTAHDNIFAGVVNLENNGTLTLNDDVNVTSTMIMANQAIATDTNNTGTLTLLGTSTISGYVGTSDKMLAAVNSGAIGANSTFLNDVYATTLTNTGTGTTNLDGNFTGTTLHFGEDGLVNVANGQSINANVTTDANNTGTLTFVQDGTMNGNIGTADKAIKTLNIGGTGSGLGIDTSTDVSSTTTINGNVYATTTSLNSSDSNVSSVLNMASGFNLNSTVVTETNATGILNLIGGTQYVTGTVGTDTMRLAQVNSGADDANATFQNDVYAIDVNNTGTGTTNFDTNVTATTINVNNGTSNFTNNVVATTTNIGTGTGNFNTNGIGTTTSDIAFSDVGTANLHTGLTGNIDFTDNNATVNVWDAQTITGDINSTGGVNGTVNFKGSGALIGNIGTSVNDGIATLNLEANATTVSVNGNIYAGIIDFKGDANLSLANGMNITGTNAVALTGMQQVISTDTNNTGTLTLAGGNTITGVVGASNKALKAIELTTGDATFNNMVYAQTVNIDSNFSRVVLNGQNGATGGLQGTVNFNNTTSFLDIGNDVNLTTGANGIQFANANSASMFFDGNSTVTGVVGGNTAGNSTLQAIYAGEDGSTVTFKNDVHVMEQAGGMATVYVDGTGTVNFQGNLYGDLVFDQNGTVNVSDTKSLIVTQGEPEAATMTASTGTINFFGATTLSGDIGQSGMNLSAVNFNTARNNVTQVIDKNIYADTTTIGHISGGEDSNTTLHDVTGQYDYAGATQMSVWQGQTAANIDANVTFGGNLVIADAKSAINFGISQVNVLGDMTTNNGAMSFTVNTQDISNNQSGLATGSGSAHVAITDALNMSGDEKIQINYVGSLKNGGSYDLINAGSMVGAYDHNETKVSGVQYVSDNSFAIDTSIKNNGSTLTVYADRTGSGAYAASEDYNEKANLMGNFSNGAGNALGAISAAGTQTGDMVQVIQKLEIDSFGYGNTAQNLATQIKRLAPIANDSFSQSSMSANTLTLNTVSSRIADLRGDSSSLAQNSTSTNGISAGDEALQYGAWVKVIGATANQDKDGQYNGYSTTSTGIAMGIDKTTSSNVTLGVAFGMTHTSIDQKDFRDGDSATTESYNVVAYAAKDWAAAYLEGALSYAYHTTDSDRATAVGRTANATIDASQYTAHINAGYRFNVNNKATITPFLAADYTHLDQDGYTETGAGAINLTVNSTSVDRTTLGGGFRVGTKLTAGHTTFLPELKIAAYDYLNQNAQDITAQYVGGGTEFVTPGTKLDNTMYNFGLGLKAEISSTTSLGLTIDYDRSGDGLFQGYTGQLVGRIKF